MPQDHVNSYEGLFLFAQSESGDLQAVIDHLSEILARAEAELISLRKWDERRLAYEIKGHKRGMYFLVYFRARGSALAGIERDCNLSERLLRSMIVRADHIPPDQMQAADGRAQLEDEIRLRAEQSAATAAPTKVVEEAAETDDPVQVQVESVPKDAATTAEA